MTEAARVLVFDVNETLIDIESLTPVFEQGFGDPAAMREWFGLVLTYSMTTTLAGRYVDFFTLSQAVLRMLGSIRGVDVDDDFAHALKRAMLTMPAHPDAPESLAALRGNGFRLVTLTNSPPNPDGPSPLEHAGLGHFFEQQFSIDAQRAFKPAPASYRFVCDRLEVTPADCMLVAAHAWDTIGAQAVGYRGALITRKGDATLAVPGLPEPDIVVGDLRQLAEHLTQSQPPASTG